MHAYAESDGRVGTAVLHVEPKDGAGKGDGDVAVAVRLDGSRALGFDVTTHALDPSALYAVAPPGNVTLSARGGISGRSFQGARGNLVVDLARLRLGSGELGPVSATIRVDHGSFEVPRLSLNSPGLRLEGSGSLQQGGAALARLTGEVDDLARAADNAGKLFGRGLPHLAGRGRVQATLSGTSMAPVVEFSVSAPALSLDATSATGIEAHLSASGPLRSGHLELESRLERLELGGKAIAVDCRLAGTAGPAPGEPGIHLKPVQCIGARALPQRHSRHGGGGSHALPDARAIADLPACHRISGNGV